MNRAYTRPGTLHRYDKCQRCGVPKDQNRKDQKASPGKWPCLNGGSHKFTVWEPETVTNQD
ncbi:hypothetical protein FDH62_gp27 [Arthrobacter phage Pumancara]|uniref:Uncharacterized protein n=1 Tax=Arthrobacter phage Pumancara TaxID=1772311 RepID=A0A0U4JNP6_9CAUD|nr:hypothetical protein FDH62_gp27 [Arthrobacter phage Pumancara]ALY09985.1 hypothetical protein PUMANCARA_27 [Arthrobacter phage Pumancara]